MRPARPLLLNPPGRQQLYERYERGSLDLFGAIRLANGSVIYSEGLGSVRFLSDNNFYITIHDILFVPSPPGLFASNRFVREHRDDYS